MLGIERLPVDKLNLAEYKELLQVLVDLTHTTVSLATIFYKMSQDVDFETIQSRLHRQHQFLDKALVYM